MGDNTIRIPIEDGGSMEVPRSDPRARAYLARSSVPGYTVRAGDSLYTIAKNQLGDPRMWPNIAALNHIKNPNLIFAGQRLLLPVGEKPMAPPAPSKAPTETAHPTILSPILSRTPKLPSFNTGMLSGGAKVLAISGIDLSALGNQADFMRELYNRRAEEILKTALERVAKGEDEGAVARWCVNERNILKVRIRGMGPALFKKIAEWRNRRKYGDINPSYERLANGLRGRGVPPEEIDIRIITNAKKTSSAFNGAGSKMRIAGIAIEAGALVLTAMVDSPESLEPLPVSDDEAERIERARIRYKIPATANIDRHGHLKPGFYLQIDPFDPHVDREFDAETEEILWWLGVDITYHYRGVSWTVPGAHFGVPEYEYNQPTYPSPAPAAGVTPPNPPPPPR